MNEERDTLELQLSATQTQYLEEAKHANIIQINLVAMKAERDATQDAFQTQLTKSQMQHEEEVEKFNKIQIDPW